jgi:CubicO group peptidase (beta-lactamase class C family)
MRMTILALALAPALCVGASLIDKARVDATLGGFIESHALIGVSALVYEDGREAYFGAFGQADREAGKAMTRDTLVQIFSMTKPITALP